MNYYISDLHIGHENVIRHDGRPFTDSVQMATEIASRWNSTVSCNDCGTSVVLCHYPIAHWKGQYRGAVHLYGHIHNTKDYTAFERYREICRELEIPFECYNVGCMMPYMDYTPKTLEQIRNSARAYL